MNAKVLLNPQKVEIYLPVVQVIQDGSKSLVSIFLDQRANGRLTWSTKSHMSISSPPEIKLEGGECREYLRGFTFPNKNVLNKCFVRTDRHYQNMII